MTKTPREELKDKLKEELKKKLLEDMEKDIIEELESNKDEILTELNEEMNAKSDDDPSELKILSFITDDNGIKLDLDWNDNLIKDLRNVGFDGIDDNEVIRKYLMWITQEAAKDLPNENSNEFE